MFFYRRLTSCFKVFTYLRKSYIRSTVGQTRLNSIAIINIARSYPKRIRRKSMDWIIDIFVKIKNSESFLLNNWILDPICTCFNDFVILSEEDSFNSLNCVLILYKEHSAGFNILHRWNRAMVEKSFFKHFFSLYKVLLECSNCFNQTICNLYSLIGYIPKSTNRFTQKCDCFQSYSHKWGVRKHIMK